MMGFFSSPEESEEILFPFCVRTDCFTVLHADLPFSSKQGFFVLLSEGKGGEMRRVRASLKVGNSRTTVKCCSEKK